MTKPSRLLLVLLILPFALFVADPVEAWDKEASRAAALEATEAFKGRSFVAKLTLGAAQQYYVLPDGAPATESGKRQGKGGADSSTFWMPGGKIKVREGQRGHNVYVWAKKDRVVVGLHDKPGKVLNSAIVNILFDRETTPADYEPAKVAAALVSLVEIEGFEPGAEIAAAFDETIGSFQRSAESTTAESDTASPAPVAGPTVLSLQVSAEPAVVSPGGEVQLVLTYEVTGPDQGVSVTETRTLLLGREIMPTFPSVDELNRSPGPVRSVFGQPLPASITPGSYTFQGKVCVGADCIQRSVSFEIR